MLPLHGIRVLDLTRALSGPLCTTLLGDLGADVVKVEPTPRGDAIRLWGPYHDGVSIYHLSVNRNKRSVALDLRAEAGQDLLHRLTRTADVLVKNFRPGVLESLGLDEKQRARSYPELIVTSITGFGPTGPRHADAGYDQIAQGMAGLMAVTGGPEEAPRRVGIPIADVLSGMFAALGVVASLHSRDRNTPSTGVQTSLLESTVAVMTFQAQRFLSLGEIPTATGNDHPLLAPYGVFDTADSPINIAVGTDGQWRALAAVTGLTHLANDPSFATTDARSENRARLRDVLEHALATADHTHWLDHLRSAGVPCGPINSMDAVFADEQMQELGLISEIPHPTLGAVSLVRGPLWFNGQPQQIRYPPPLYGQHTAEMLAEVGLSSAELDDLRAQAVIPAPPSEETDQT